MGEVIWKPTGAQFTRHADGEYELRIPSGDPMVGFHCITVCPSDDGYAANAFSPWRKFAWNQTAQGAVDIIAEHYAGRHDALSVVLGMQRGHQ